LDCRSSSNNEYLINITLYQFHLKYHFDLILPDFFSPNGDGVNDAWVIGELQRYQNNQVWVYDAAGNLVFSQKQYLNDWLGTNNGIPLPKASYLYMIDADGDGTIDYQGWVFITR